MTLNKKAMPQLSPLFFCRRVSDIDTGGFANQSTRKSAIGGIKSIRKLILNSFQAITGMKANKLPKLGEKGAFVVELQSVFFIQLTFTIHLPLKQKL